MRVAASLAFAAAALFGTAAQAQVNVKIGVMNDMSGLYADISGPGAVAGGKTGRGGLRSPPRTGMKVDIVGADHAEQARRGRRHRAALGSTSTGVDVIVDVPTFRRGARGQRYRAARRTRCSLIPGAASLRI